MTRSLVDGIRERAYVLFWEARGLTTPSAGLRARTRLLQKSQHWPRARLDDLRDRKLRALVSHAWNTIPRYRRLMEAHGVRPEDIRTHVDLPRLPVLTKDELREHGSELRATGVTEIEENVTGGTTGAPTRVARDVAGATWSARATGAASAGEASSSAMRGCSFSAARSGSARRAVSTG